MRDQSVKPMFDIEIENENILIATAKHEGVELTLEYNKEECRKNGIDSTDTKHWVHSSNDPHAATKLKNKLNEWLKKDHYEKFM